MGIDEGFGGSDGLGVSLAVLQVSDDRCGSAEYRGSSSNLSQRVLELDPETTVFLMVLY